MPPRLEAFDAAIPQCVEDSRPVDGVRPFPNRPQLTEGAIAVKRESSKNLYSGLVLIRESPTGKRHNMGCVERDREIKRRRARRVKLKKLRAQFAKSSNEGERVMLLAKARKISPMFSFEEEKPVAAKKK